MLQINTDLGLHFEVFYGNIFSMFTLQSYKVFIVVRPNIGVKIQPVYPSELVQKDRDYAGILCIKGV